MFTVSLHNRNIVYQKHTVLNKTREYCILNDNNKLLNYTFPVNHEYAVPDSKVHGANMGPTWADRTHVDPMWATWTLLSGVF